MRKKKSVTCPIGALWRIAKLWKTWQSAWKYVQIHFHKLHWYVNFYAGTYEERVAKCPYFIFTGKQSGRTREILMRHAADGQFYGSEYFFIYIFLTIFHNGTNYYTNIKENIILRNSNTIIVMIKSKRANRCTVAISEHFLASTAFRRCYHRCYTSLAIRKMTPCFRIPANSSRIMRALYAT